MERLRARSAEIFGISPWWRAVLGMCLATSGWGGVFLGGKIVVAELSPLAATAWRYVAACLILVPLALRWRGRVRLRPFAADLVVMVACGGVLYPWLLFSALQRTTATNTSLIVALMPVLALLFSRVLGERIEGRRWCGVALALLGAGIVITRGGSAATLNPAHLNGGDLLALVAACVWATFNLASRRVAVLLPATVIGSVLYCSGGAILFGLAARQHPAAQLAAASPLAWFCLLAMGTLSSALCGQLYMYGIRVLGVSRAVLFVYLVPVSTAVLSHFVLGEAIETPHLLGGAAVFTGLVLGSGAPDKAPLRVDLHTEEYLAESRSAA